MLTKTGTEMETESKQTPPLQRTLPPDKKITLGYRGSSYLPLSDVIGQCPSKPVPTPEFECRLGRNRLTLARRRAPKCSCCLGLTLWKTRNCRLIPARFPPVARRWLHGRNTIFYFFFFVLVKLQCFENCFHSCFSFASVYFIGLNVPRSAHIRPSREELLVESAQGTAQCLLHEGIIPIIRKRDCEADWQPRLSLEETDSSLSISFKSEGVLKLQDKHALRSQMVAQ